MALGFQALIGSDIATWKRKNMRREIMYAFPTGASPLCGLLSLLEPDPIDGPEYSWLENRWKEVTTVTVESVGTSANFGGWLPGASGVATATVVLAADDTERLAITTGDEAKFPVGSIIMVTDCVINGGSTTTHVRAQVTAVASGILTLRVFDALTIDNAIGNAGKQVILLGNAQIEGSLSGNSRPLIFPIEITNYNQIFRDSQAFSATTLTQPAEFDKSGFYKTAMRELQLVHMVGLENALLFGSRTKFATTATDAATSATNVRTLGGIYWFLQEWEKSGGGTFGYRPGGSALTAWDDEDKRIVTVPSTGALTEAQFENLLARIFTKKVKCSDEKLLLCGQGVIVALNTYYKDKIVTNKDFAAEHKLGFDLRTIETSHGVLHFRSHPRFNAQSWLKYDGFVLDVGNLRLRPTAGRDTHINQSIHAPDFDGRKDEFFTDVGFEVRFPETHMYLRNFKSITAS